MQPTDTPGGGRPTLVGRDGVLLAGAALCLWPGVSAAAALIGGVILGLAGANTRPEQTSRLARILLQASVVALGATMNLAQVVHAGTHGIGITFLSITATLILGQWLGRALRVPAETAILVSGGTAICGGSAIAAIAGALRPSSHAVTISLATVFLLNAVALLIFPPIGHAFGLTQPQFGWWAALAIHDTSSVVGAGLAYGSAALAVATTVKLARALWIAPLTLWFGLRRRKDGDGASAARPHMPWFILGFVVVAALFTFAPALAGVGHVVGRAAQQSLVLTLFLIGAGFTRQAVKVVGLRPLALGLSLWIIVATVSLILVKTGIVG